MSTIQVPVAVLALSRSERENTRLEFYVKRDGDVLYFCYAYPDFGQEYIQKTWIVDPHPIYQPTILVRYGENNEIEIPKRNLRIFKEQLGLSDDDVWIVSESSETVFSIKEILDNGKIRYMDYPGNLIKNEIKSRTFSTTYI